MSDCLFQVIAEGEDGAWSVLYESYDRRACERHAAKVGDDQGAINVYIDTVRYPLSA